MKPTGERTTAGSRAPIEQFAIDYGIPMVTAIRLIGKTEEETEANMKKYLIAKEAAKEEAE